MTIKTILLIALVLYSYVGISNISRASANLVDESLPKTDKTINVTLYKNGSSYEVKQMNVVIGDASYRADYAAFKGRVSNGTIVSFKGNALGYFEVPLGLSVIICSDSFGQNPGETVQGSCIETSEGDITLQLPYFPNGKYADIYDPSGKKILTIDLSSEAACNENGICDRPMEDQINCGSDCSALKNSAALMDTNPKGEKANPPRNTGLGRFGVYIFVALVSVSLFVLGLWVWRKVKGNNVV